MMVIFQNVKVVFKIVINVKIPLLVQNAPKITNYMNLTIIIFAQKNVKYNAKIVINNITQQMVVNAFKHQIILINVKNKLFLNNVSKILIAKLVIYKKEPA